MSHRHANQWHDNADDESPDDSCDRYDDSQGYSGDGDDDEDYQEFLEHEFGAAPSRSRLTRLQFWTTLVLLFSFALPFLIYLFLAITQ
jgi:hypothetical protein